MSKRLGKGSAASEVATSTATAGSKPSSDATGTISLTTNVGVGGGDGEKANKLAAAALLSIRSCYRTCFAAVLADVIITIIDADLYAKFFGDRSSSLSWVDYVDVLDSMAFFTFGYGLYRISSFYERSNATKKSNKNMNRSKQQFKSKRKIEDEDLVNMLRCMSISWGIISINFALVAISMAAALPAHGQNGPFHSLIHTISPSNAATTTIAVVLGGGLAIEAYCNRAARREDSADNQRISTLQRESKHTNTVYSYTRKIGYRAYRNQALCVGTFTLTSIMELLKWIVEGEGGIVGRVLSVSDVLGPFAISYLLFRLNKSFLRAAVIRLRDTGETGLGKRGGRGDLTTMATANDDDNDDDDQVYNDLFIAQTSFYEKVAEAMKDATIFRLLPYLVRPFGPTILNALEGISPWLAEKVVQLWDIMM